MDIRDKIEHIFKRNKHIECEIIEVKRDLKNLSEDGNILNINSLTFNNGIITLNYTDLEGLKNIETDITSISVKYNVLNYNQLLTVTNPLIGNFAYVQQTQGISWLPGSLGGTFYNKGIYYYDGINWKTTDIPYQATLQQVNDGVSNDVFITPYSLKNSNTKLNAYIEHVSDDIIPSFTPIAIVNNLAYKFDNQNINHKFAFAGFSINGTAIGEICKIQQIGEVELIGWNLIPNTQYLAGPNGSLLTATNTPNDFIKVLGYATTSDKLLIIKDYTTILKI